MFVNLGILCTPTKILLTGGGGSERNVFPVLLDAKYLIVDLTCRRRYKYRHSQNICFLVDHWKDESASGKLHKGNDIYIFNEFLITRLHICQVSPPHGPLRTDNFVPTPSNVCWTINQSL